MGTARLRWLVVLLTLALVAEQIPARLVAVALQQLDDLFWRARAQQRQVAAHGAMFWFT